jgi:vitamin B12 transporter
MLMRPVRLPSGGRVAREDFIAKMKRESGACSGGVLLLSPTTQIPMHLVLPLRRAIRRFAFTLAAFAAVSLAPAQTPPQLPPFITSATRTPADRQTLGSAVDGISGEDLARRQIRTLAEALGGVAGAPHFASGAGGAITSLFLRGANSNQTLFLIDGLRMNDSNTDYQVFLGGACISACDSLEVAHGPQSTLYGGEAVGGVIALRSERGAGAPSARVAFEGGSFGTWQGRFAAQGERGRDAWNLAVQGGHTDNARPNNAFDSANTTLRLDRRVNERVAVGSTLRWFHGVYGSPGTRFTNDPDNEEREDNVLATAFADLTLGAAWTARAVLGGQDRRFVAESPSVGRATQNTVVKNRRAVLDGQTSFAGFVRHRVTAGFTAETNHTRNTGFGNINERQGLWAVFAQDEWSPRDDLHFTAGLRNDDFDTFGRATTGRTSLAWLATQSLKLRASYGTAFRSPSFLDLYGESAFYAGNPKLRPERARGWDAGVDYYVAGGRGTVSATWFDTGFTNLIASTEDFRSVDNIHRARTRGLELSSRMMLGPAFEARLNYTHLEAENLSTGARLLRRPRQSGSADALWTVGRRFTTGAGVTLVARRRDVDARTFAQIDAEDYAIVRLHASWQATPRLALKVRIENLLDEEYEEVNGYPALGRGAFVAMELSY